MPLPANILKSLNDQLNHEINAAYNYFAMAAWFEAENLPGFAKWMMIQRAEELEHAMRIYDYINDRDGEAHFGPLGEPVATFDSINAVFLKGLELEKANTAAIHTIFGMAVEEKDYATQSMLQWFIDEQVEEEKTMREVLGLLELAGDDRAALLALNRELGARVPE